MTLSQRRQLRRFCRRAVAHENYDPLVCWVDMYAARPGTPVRLSWWARFVALFA